MSKHDLCCTHCGKFIPYGTDALDFEYFIFCSKDCISEEINDSCYSQYYIYLSDEAIEKIIEKSGGIRPFNWSITDC